MEHSGQEVREEVWVFPLHHRCPTDILCFRCVSNLSLKFLSLMWCFADAVAFKESKQLTNRFYFFNDTVKKNSPTKQHMKNKDLQGCSCSSSTVKQHLFHRFKGMKTVIADTNDLHMWTFLYAHHAPI